MQILDARRVRPLRKTFAAPLRRSTSHQDTRQIQIPIRRIIYNRTAGAETTRLRMECSYSSSIRGNCTLSLRVGGIRACLRPTKRKLRAHHAVTKEKLDAYFAACRARVIPFGSELRITVHPGCTEDELRRCELEFGAPLSPSLSEVLRIYNGFELQTFGSHPRSPAESSFYSEWLYLFGTASIITESAAHHKERSYLTEQSEWPPLRERFLSFGRIDDHAMIAAVDRSDQRCPAGEYPVLYFDDWLYDDWPVIAYSVEEWLTRSLESMVETPSGFGYYVGLEPWK